MAIALGKISKQWQVLATAASIGASTAAAALFPPPAENAKGLVVLGGFLATAVCGLIYVGMTKYSGRQYTRLWTAAAALTILGAYASVEYYDSMRNRFVGTYLGKEYIAGDQHTASGTAWIAKSGHTDPTDLLFDASGHPEYIWTPVSIQRITFNMRSVYYACVILLAASVLATVQAVFCGTRRTPHTSREAPRTA